MGGSSTTVQKADPWKAVQPHLLDVADSAQGLYESGGFAADPYTGQRVAGFGGTTQSAHDMISQLAGLGSPLTGQAGGFLSNMMSGDYMNDAVTGAMNNALGAAIPAAVAPFSGAGMANSTQAMDYVGRAAMDAAAPYTYGAMENAMNRGMSAAGMAPGIEQAGYFPAQMLSDIGLAQDIMSQTELDALMQQYYESQGQEAANLGGYASMLMPLGGMGGQSTSTTRQGLGLGDLMGLAGSGIQAFALMSLLSDRRLKDNIAKVGETPHGHNLYSYNYKGSPTVQFGVMADEVPHAVAGHVAGFAFVDYARL